MMQYIPKNIKPVLTQNWIKLSYCAFGKHGSLNNNEYQNNQQFSVSIKVYNYEQKWLLYMTTTKKNKTWQQITIVIMLWAF